MQLPSLLFDAKGAPMSQFAMILVTTLMTILGVVIAQILQRLIIEPLQEFQRARGKIADAITRYWGAGGAFTNEDGDLIRPEPEELKTAACEMRSYSAGLPGAAAVLPFYRLRREGLR